MPTLLKALFEAPGPSMTQAQLRSVLRGCAATRFKTAAIGGEQEQGFEQAFSSLGYAYLKDKAPRLLDFIVGFQLVDRNEDNTKAMGVFGFQIGDQWVYAPIFFLNGDLKGHELLYVKNKDMFLPMKENWVNYLISKRSHTLGEASEQNTMQLGGLMPNLSRLSQPPTSGKYASDQEVYMPKVAGWAEPFLPIVGAAATGTMQPKLAEVRETLDLHKWLTDLPALHFVYDHCYRSYPLIKAGFDRFYGPDFFLKQAQAIKKRAESFIMPPRKRKPLKSKRPVPSLVPKPQEEPLKQAGVTVYVYDGERIRKWTKQADNEPDPDRAITEHALELTDEERQRLLRDTVLIKDERDEKSISVAYNTQIRMELTNPTESGLYDVLEKPAAFDRMLVLTGPHTGRGRERFTLVIRKSDPRSWLNTANTELFVRPNEAPDKDEFSKFVNDLGGVESLSKGGTYIALHENGSGTCPFTVKEDYGDGSYKVRWHDSSSYHGRRPGFLSGPDYQWDRDRETGYSSYDAQINLNRRKGSGLRSVRGELSLPDDYKIITVQAPKKPKTESPLLSGCVCPPEMSEGGSQSEDRPIHPGNLVDVQLMIFEKSAELRLHDTGTEVWLKTASGKKRFDKKAALIELVQRHGLREEQARIMLKEAAQAGNRNLAMTYRVKYAQGFNSSLQPGPSAPAIPEPWMGSEPVGYDSYPAQYPQEEYLPVDSMSSQFTDPSIYDPFYKPDKQTMQVAQQASQSGQKEVFDTAMLSGMLKAVRQDSLVDRYLGSLMKSVDALGRILFMLYWHAEEFEDRYGKQDMPELEDAVRNAFEGVADVVLFLKERQVGDMDDMVGAVGTPSEPNVDEAAKN